MNNTISVKVRTILITHIYALIVGIVFRSSIEVGIIMSALLIIFGLYRALKS